MDRILITLGKTGPMASSAHLLGLYSIIFEHVYWYIQQISSERLQDHWSSGYHSISSSTCVIFATYLFIVKTSLT